MQLQLSVNRLLIAAWGVFGVILLFSQAIVRLGVRALEAIEMGLTPMQFGILLLWIVFNGYGEGYRAFQKRFSPRVVARAMHLAHHPKPIFVVFAPLYCMAFFHATKRARIIAWATVTLIICLIALLRFVPQPWRGIVDAGVVLALIWGALAMLFFFARAAFTRNSPDVSAALPAK